MIGHRHEQLQRRAQHAVEAEPAAIDVVAEQHELDVGIALRIPLVRPRALDEVRLQERRLEAAVAAVQITEHDELDGRVRPHHVDVAIEKPRSRPAADRSP